MDRIYIYLSHNWYDCYFSEKELTEDELYCPTCEEYDTLYGYYEEEELLGKAIQDLFDRGYQLIDMDRYIDLLKKYATPKILKRIKKIEWMRQLEERINKSERNPRLSFEVMSRKRLEEIAGKIETSCVIISIIDPDSANVAVKENEHIESILRLSFADVDRNIPSAMTAEDAEKIEVFFEYWKERVSKIIVQCETGISRSAGVCAALMKKHLDDSQIFDNHYYKPNMHCYNLMMKCNYEDIWK